MFKLRIPIRWGGKRLAVIAAVLGIVTVLGSGFLFRSKPSPPAPVPVRVEIAGGTAGASGPRYSASIKPKEQVELAFKVDGYVREIIAVKGADGSVRELRAGDRVSRGMVLARLDDKDHVARAHQARASVAEAKAALVQAQKDHERALALVNGGYLARSEYDQAVEKLNTARAKLDGAHAQQDQYVNQVDDSQLKSPLDGVVASRTVERGTLVASGTKAFVLVDLSSVKAVFGVADSQLATVKPGAALAIRVDALNRDFKGTVTAVSPSADATNRVFDVEVTIPNPDGALKDGMIASVRLNGLDAALQAQDKPQAPAFGIGVPMQAVVRQPDGPRDYMVYVLVEKDGRTLAQARPVKLGDVAGRNVAVLEGLKPGERVVTAGTEQLYDGASVVIVP
ncbi:MAG: efflux RND transporter periplasmic adaptor subunit [Humidesulfovibrio sp.]|nr:efflux RND transporter periplasmic adaptor subunit [Humidesulfovibrio sp.]